MRPRASIAAFAAVVLVAGCGGSKHAAPASTRKARPPAAHGALRFVPLSFTAVSEDDYWLLGTRPCAAGRCFSILRTNDGGRSFARSAAPPLVVDGVTPTLRFADHDDGWAFVTGYGGVFYATHDGGATWRKLPLPTVLAFATGGGNAYVVTARCTRAACTSFRFERSPVSQDAWSTEPMPFVPDGTIADLVAHGSRLWLLATPAGTRGPHDEIASLGEGGRGFVTGDGPCWAGLGGSLAPSSADVVWGVCPGGTLGTAMRSTDGGATFSPLRTPPLVNSAVVAPASDDVAVLAANGANSPLLRTADGGRSWRRARTPVVATFVPFVGFTDAKVGAALAQLGAHTTALWRTTDGGAHWFRVRLP